MIDIVYTISKYLTLICFVVFTITSFRVQRDIPDELKIKSYTMQRSLILAIHALSFFVICLHVLSGDAQINLWYLIAFYIAQLAYLLVMTMLIPRFVRLNRGLNHVMCMFLAIGFIFQTRLDFENSVKQFLIMLAGTVLFLIFCFFCKRAKFMRHLTWIYCIAGLGLLLLVLILSTVSRGARLSLELGPFSFQPLEFVKILFVLFVAGAFHKSTSFKMVVITAVCAAVHVLIQVFCNDLGSAFILFLIYLMMLYVATRRFVYVLLGTAAFSAAAVAAYHLFGHVRVRIQTWQDPWKDINGTGYQIAQSLFAIGTGGWFGSGLFKGNPSSIPLVSKDMIISAISEEFGAIFGIFLILLCLCFVLMIFRVAIRIEMTFYKLLAFGLGVCYAVQVFLTIGGALKFIPLTGVTLPFISSGGSSMLASFIMLGIIQALYVISESDVAHERRMVAAGADLSEFAGYEDLAERRQRRRPVQDDRSMEEPDDFGYEEEEYEELYDDSGFYSDYDYDDPDGEWEDADRQIRDPRRHVITRIDMNDIHERK
ncbi:MAG: FtsW/RodA/SpoVE family cell cycle protein [Parasporobacterium sp.]|nr:FtsW/RodA/SpoVE family cell cycle protein [Parasporobacterium sp.]